MKLQLSVGVFLYDDRKHEKNTAVAHFDSQVFNVTFTIGTYARMVTKHISVFFCDMDFKKVMTQTIKVTFLMSSCTPENTIIFNAIDECSLQNYNTDMKMQNF